MATRRKTQNLDPAVRSRFQPQSGVVALIFLALFASYCAGRDVRHGHYIVARFAESTSDQSLSCLAVTQLNDGRMLFGSAGLLEFDGERWSHSPQRLSSIFDLDVGPDGRVWSAALEEAGWFERSAGGSWKYHSIRQVVPTDVPVTGNVWHIFHYRDGAVFSTAERVYRWDGQRCDTWHLPTKGRLGMYRIGGEIYVYSPKDGLYHLKEHGPELLIPQSALAMEDRHLLLEIIPGEKRWILATSYGLVLYDLATRTCQPVAPDLAEVFRTAQITDAAALPDGRYAFSTVQHGVYITSADFQVEANLHEPDGVSNYVCALLVDKEGSLWLTGPSGPARVHISGHTRIYDARGGLSPRPYNPIAAAGNSVVVGNLGMAFGLSADRRSFVPLPNPFGGVGRAVPGADGIYLSQQNRVGRYRDSDVALLFRIPGQTVTALLNARSGPDLYCGTLNGEISKWSASGIRTEVSALPAWASSLAEDQDGRLWIATDEGLWIADPRTPGPASRPAESYDVPDWRGSTMVRSTTSGDVFLFANWRAWVKPAGASRFQAVEGYYHPRLRTETVDDVNRAFWVARTGVDGIRDVLGYISSDTGWRWQPYSVPELDSIGRVAGLSADEDENGHTVLWIGGTRGVLRHVVKPKAALARPRAPLLSVFGRDAKGTRTAIAGTLPYETPSIEFEFAQPEFARRAQLRLETKIEGLDPEWTPAGRDSRRELSGMRDGSYTFMVRAVAETGLIGEPTVFGFTVAPPWWRNRTALVLEAIAAALLVYGGYRWRVRQMHARTVELEQRVRERTEELVQANAAKTQFVANMSHDIRNPLNGIVGLTLALEDTPLDGQQRELVSTLRECTTYLSSLVEDVLDFARIEAGKIELRPEPFAPAELLNSVVTALKKQAADAGATISIETDPELPPLLEADAGRVQQILVNYVSNAVKYARGHIRLSAGLPVDRAGEIEFAVADEGPGIQESDRATLFTKFGRLESARQSNVQGTGLGLAACKILADAMGGSVDVDSTPSHGSRFILRLPLVVAARRPVVATDDLLPPTSVLLVEDADYNAIAATAVLRRLGLSCDRARDGAEALKRFGEKRHAIVLLDRNLPDMDGTEVARQMRDLETDGTRALLLAVTAYSTEDDRKVCLAAGMDAFLGKPLTPDKLRKVLLSAIGGVSAAGRVMADPKSLPEHAIASSAGEASIDWTFLEFLAETSEGGVAAQTERYLAELGARHQAVADALAHRAIKDVVDSVHRLRGHASLISATNLLDACANLEAAGRANKRDEIASLAAAVGNEVAALTAAMRRHRPAHRV